MTQLKCIIVSIDSLLNASRREIIMKHFNKKVILMLILIGVFIFTGCSNLKLKTNKDTDDGLKSNIENINDPEEINSSDQDDIDNHDSNDEELLDDDTPTTTVIQPTRNIELLIYVVNSETELDPVIALVPADNEITPSLVVDTVVDSMADQSLAIGIESVTTQDDTVIISFYSNQPPLSNVGSGFEVAILDAIAQSITENLDDYNKIIYRVEGGPYISGHIALGIDEIYFED